MNAIAWVHANCKFAAPSNIGKTLSPIEIQQTVNRLIPELSKQLVPGANYVTTKQQVQMALQNALNQQGAGMQVQPKHVDEIMRALGFNMPNQGAMVQGPQGWEDPGMAALRQQRAQPPKPQPREPRPMQMPRKPFE